MSALENPFTESDGWWNELNLSYHHLPVTSRHELEVQQAAITVLNAHPPVGFAGSTEGRTITARQLNELVDRAVQCAEQEAKRRRQADADEQRLDGWEKVEQALSGRKANKPIESGRWVGFTWGEATAWCWNLFQYEPRGFVHPGIQVRHEAMRRLQSGELPEVFGYPEQAREYADRGLTPREYRRMQEALGRRIFSPRDVTHYAKSASLCDACGRSPAAR